MTNPLFTCTVCGNKEVESGYALPDGFRCRACARHETLHREIEEHAILHKDNASEEGHSAMSASSAVERTCDQCGKASLTMWDITGPSGHKFICDECAGVKTLPPKATVDSAREKAEAHWEWEEELLRLLFEFVRRNPQARWEDIEPLLKYSAVTHSVHFYGHGIEDAQKHD